MTTVTLSQETLAGSRVKAKLVRGHLRWLNDSFGERVTSRVLRLLPKNLAVEVMNAQKADWCSFESLIRLDYAIAEVCARSASDVWRDLGRSTARNELAGTSRSFSRADIHRYLRCSAVLDSHFLDQALCGYDEIDDVRGVMTIRGASSYSPVYCSGVAGYYEQVVAMHGGHSPITTEAACRCDGDEVCVFEIAWQ